MSNVTISIVIGAGVLVAICGTILITIKRDRAQKSRK